MGLCRLGSLSSATRANPPQKRHCLHGISWTPTISGRASASASPSTGLLRKVSSSGFPRLHAAEALHPHLGKSITRPSLALERPHPLLSLAHPRKATPQTLDPPGGASSRSSPRILAGTMKPPPDSSTSVSYSLPPPPRRPRFPAPFCRPQPPSPHPLQFLKGLGNHRSSVSWTPQAALQPRHAVGSRPPPVLLLLGASLCS